LLQSTIKSNRKPKPPSQCHPVPSSAGLLPVIHTVSRQVYASRRRVMAEATPWFWIVPAAVAMFAYHEMSRSEGNEGNNDGSTSSPLLMLHSLTFDSVSWCDGTSLCGNCATNKPDNDIDSHVNEQVRSDVLNGSYTVPAARSHIPNTGADTPSSGMREFFQASLKSHCCEPVTPRCLFETSFDSSSMSHSYLG
jgi:hypothetical protein